MSKSKKNNMRLKKKGGTIYTKSKVAKSKSKVAKSKKRVERKKESVIIVKEMKERVEKEKKIREWKQIANIQYDSYKEMKSLYKNKMTKEQQQIEQEWSDNNITILMDFMGSNTIWNAMVKDIQLYDDGSKSIRNMGISDKPIAVYTRGHWYSRKANNDKTQSFDSYSANLQPNGSNQFCQTYAMMYLLDRIKPEKNISFESFYANTKKALDFIKEVITKHIDLYIEKESKQYDDLIEMVKKDKDDIKTKESVKKHIMYKNEDQTEDEQRMYDFNQFDFDNHYNMLNSDEIASYINDKKPHKNIIEKALSECITYPNLCVNCIHYEESLLNQSLL